jgi:hypothetical protein
MNYEESFETIVRVAREVSFHPVAPLGTEDFLRALVSRYVGSPEHFEQWLLEITSREFRNLDEKPRWLQDPEWPIMKSHPMVFVGQIDKEFPTNRTSFYVFWDQRQTGLTRVIVQVLS